jgi:hypothetical protein
MYCYASLSVQEFTEEAEGVWDEIDHPNLKVPFLLKIGLVTAVSLRWDSYFSDPADAVFSVAPQEYSRRALTIGFVFPRADHLDLHVG